MNLFTQNQSKTEPAKVQQLKIWIYELLRLDQETTISISQLQCKEPGCPPIETAVTILTQPIQQFKIHKAIAEIEQSDLVQAFKSNNQQEKVMVPSKPSLSIPKRGMPVTIITGFLGSGKTTLLNQILKNRQDLKVAVLVNEFGDIDIDSQLLVSIEEDMVQLSNGCICCTINENLVDAVYKVLEREEPTGAARSGKPQRRAIDYLVIETTGIADPLPIILTFLGTELQDLTRLDSILTLVDVETFTPDHFDSDAALKQIIYGDILLLNKTDLVSVEQVNKLEQYINSVKQGARVIRCQRGEVPLPLILDVGYNDPEHYADLLNHPEREHVHHHHDDHDHEHHDHEHHEHHHHHSDHLEDDGFVSVSFVSDRPFALTKFQNFLDHLPADVFRGKGILWFQESQMKHIFQLSGKRCSLEVESWTNPPSNQVVLIGRNLNPEQLRQELEQCQEFEPTKLSIR